MSRGLSAPLSPHEEIALRRIAIQQSGAAEPDDRHVTRLVALELVAQEGVSLNLTPLGKRRLDTLFRNSGTGT